jgi:hypothetical protein
MTDDRSDKSIAGEIFDCGKYTSFGIDEFTGKTIVQKALSRFFYI